MIDLDKLYSDNRAQRDANELAVRKEREAVVAHIVEKMFEALGPLAQNFARVPNSDPDISGNKGARVPNTIHVEIRFADWQRSIGRLILFAQNIGGDPADVTNADGEWEPGEIDYSKIQWRRFGFIAQNFKAASKSIEIDQWIREESDIPEAVVAFLQWVRRSYDSKLEAQIAHEKVRADQDETQRKRNIRKFVLKLSWEHRNHAKSEAHADNALAALKELAAGRDIDVETYEYMRERWQLDFDAHQKKLIVAQQRRDQYVADYLAFLETFASAHAFNFQIADELQSDYDGRFKLYKLTYSQMVGGEYGVGVDNRVAHVSTADPGSAGFYQVCDRYSGTYAPVKFFNIVTVEGPEEFEISGGSFAATFIDERAAWWNWEEIVIHANAEQVGEVEKAYRDNMREWPAVPDPSDYGVKTSPDYPGDWTEDRTLRDQALKEYEIKHNPEYVEDTRPDAF